MRRLAAAFLPTFLATGCGCHGVVRAVTDRTWYAPGDDVTIRVENGSPREVEYPGRMHRVQFYRHEGGAWVLQPGPYDQEGDLAIYYGVPPCRTQTTLQRVWPDFPPGEYRIGFGTWTTNAFVIGSPKGAR
jgi:hypothetical protein